MSIIIQTACVLYRIIGSNESQNMGISILVFLYSVIETVVGKSWNITMGVHMNLRRSSKFFQVVANVSILKIFDPMLAL